MSPLLILLLGVAIVIALILPLRINAFIALIAGAIVVSLLAPGEPAEKISRVAAAFGKVAGGIGIVIALAAVTGKALVDSGAALRIVNTFAGLLGEKRMPAALMGSGFVLSVPVFFDTVFYLLVPLARSLFRRTRKNYVLYLTTIVAGGAVTHSMVPPTPGPLFMADALEVDLGTMVLVGVLSGVPMAVAGLFLCRLLNRWTPVEMRESEADQSEDEVDEDRPLPPLAVALAPVVLPVLLITANTLSSALAKQGGDDARPWKAISEVTAILGNPNLALLFSAAIALATVAVWRKRSLKQLAADSESALLSGGLVILITAAGGAFGAMLREAGIQEMVAAGIGEGNAPTGTSVLLAAFGVASLIKFAQGSGTVAMITASSIFAALGLGADSLGFHPVYLACAIGSGSLVGDWMNNSGFWIFAKMGGLTVVETLRTWSVLTAALGLTGIVTTIVLAHILPLT